jgi:hypothetical protein
MAELTTLTVERELDARNETVAATEREGNRAALNLDHLAIDLGKEGQDLIDEYTERRGRRRRLGPRACCGDEDGERENTSYVTAQSAIPSSISPRLAQGVGRVKEWENETGHGRCCHPCPALLPGSYGVTVSRTPA